MASSKHKFKYGVHPGVLMAQSSLEKLKEKTGKTIQQWAEIVTKEGPSSDRERHAWLMSAHGFGRSYATWIADWAAGRGQENCDGKSYLVAAEGYVDDMFAGPKAHLREIFEAIMREAYSLGKEVKACPCKTIVPIYRNHVFAEIKPTTRTRIDLGFALKDTPLTGRLIDTGGFEKKDRISRRIPISSIEEFDDEARDWLRRAYKMDG